MTSRQAAPPQSALLRQSPDWPVVPPLLLDDDALVPPLLLDDDDELVPPPLLPDDDAPVPPLLLDVDEPVPLPLPLVDPPLLDEPPSEPALKPQPEAARRTRTASQRMGAPL